jgi:CheY-like chemotaxis protein
MNILYLEDEASEAALVSRFIRVTPHQLTVVSTLEEAFAALDNAYDLLLVDMRIGDERGGYELVRHLRAGGSTTPIVAVTGLTFQEDVDKCYAVGCNDVLLKPFTVAQLDEKIRKYTF